jgi:hypothetical protein
MRPETQIFASNEYYYIDTYRRECIVSGEGQRCSEQLTNKINNKMTIELGHNWPVYARKWGVRFFKPLRKYGFHLHFGRYAVAVNPWGEWKWTRNPMDEPWKPFWFKQGMK